MKESLLQRIIKRIYRIYNYSLFDIIIFILDHIRKMEILLGRKLSVGEINEAIELAILYLISDKIIG